MIGGHGDVIGGDVFKEHILPAGGLAPEVDPKAVDAVRAVVGLEREVDVDDGVRALGITGPRLEYRVRLLWRYGVGTC